MGILYCKLLNLDVIKCYFYKEIYGDDLCIDNKKK